jgi:hypothetical protein
MHNASSLESADQKIARSKITIALANRKIKRFWQSYRFLYRL